MAGSFIWQAFTDAFDIDWEPGSTVGAAAPAGTVAATPGATAPAATVASASGPSAGAISAPQASQPVRAEAAESDVMVVPIRFNGPRMAQAFVRAIDTYGVGRN